MKPSKTMNRDHAISLARQCAAEQPQSYVGDPMTFQPHEWVIAAILRAAGSDDAQIAKETPP